MSADSPTKVAIVEDNAAIAKNLATIIESDAGYEGVGNFTSAETALARLPRLKPDICILDIGLPGMSGIEAIVPLREKLPDLKIVMFTVFEDAERIVQAIRRGANGYLLKDTAPALLLSELKVILLGGAALTPGVARKIINLAPTITEDTVAADGGVLLTERQIEILNLVALGFDAKEVGDELDISEHTVRHHIEKIYRRLQVNNRREAIRAGFKWGFLKHLRPD